MGHMEHLKNEFLTDTGATLQLLQDDLKALPSGLATRRGRESLDRAFRTAHSLKGVCGMFGLNDMSRVSHAMEDLLEGLRDGRLDLDERVRELLTRSHDMLHDLLGAARSSPEEASDPADFLKVVEEVEAMLPPGQDAPGATQEASPPEDPPGPETTRTDGTDGSASVRVPVARMDDLLESFTALVDARRRLSTERSGSPGDRPRTGATLPASFHLDRELRRLGRRLLRLRTVPWSLATQHLERVMERGGREGLPAARLVVEGANTPLDRALSALLEDPLSHLVRNALTHGIESPDERIRNGKPPEGRVTVRASSGPSEVTIEVADDGRGVDLDLVRQRAAARGGFTQDSSPTEEALLEAIFQPGFTTAQHAGLLSGRGVGLDAVRAGVARAGGVVQVLTGAWGTRFSFRVPVRWAIAPGLLAEAGGAPVVVPLPAVRQLHRLSDMTLRVWGSGEEARVEENWVPVVDLGARFGGLPVCRGSDRGSAVFVQIGRRGLVFLVDAVLHQQEFLVRPFRAPLRNVPGCRGTVELDDGTLAPVLEPAEWLLLEPGRVASGEGNPWPNATS
ncbi:MAG: Hpt domain-containing protein [Gemmatimonadota bacterium]|nr:Hpt domain-containing protein [Gemmatimonadota bacterium]